MEFEMKSRVYIRTDEQGRIVRCEGEYTLPSDLDGWILIDEGEPCDKRNLAQSHYFTGGLYTAGTAHKPLSAQRRRWRRTERHDQHLLRPQMSVSPYLRNSLPSQTKLLLPCMKHRKRRKLSTHSRTKHSWKSMK